MKTPTLKQLKERPALWVYSSNNNAEPRITMPDKTTLWASCGHLNVVWELWKSKDSHQFALAYYDFAGWL